MSAPVILDYLNGSLDLTLLVGRNKVFFPVSTMPYVSRSVLIKHSLVYSVLRHEDVTRS